MRVTYVLPRPELGGGIKVVLEHARLLAAAGDEVTVLAEGSRPAWSPFRGPFLDRGAGTPSLPRQDAVVATFWTTLRPALELAAGPVVHYCQGYEGDLAHLAPQRAAIEEAYRLPLPALVVSPHLGDFLRREMGRESRVVPPAVEPAFRPRPRRGPRRRPWVMVPGIFAAEVKDVPTALRAVVRLGEGGLAPRLVRVSVLPPDGEERRLLPADRYLTGVAPAEVARALRRCDLLLLSSRPGEGFGLPLLEAMASGVPAVASRIPSTEAFAAGAAALVEPGDPDAFAGAARALLTDPAAWRRARRAGREAARAFRGDRVLPVLRQALEWASGAAPGDG